MHLITRSLYPLTNIPSVPGTTILLLVSKSWPFLDSRCKWDHTVFVFHYLPFLASQVALVVKNLLASAGDKRDVDLIPGLGRSPGGGHDNLLQYSCLEIPWTEEPGGLWFIGSQRVGYNWSNLACTHLTFLVSLPSRSIYIVARGTIFPFWCPNNILVCVCV